MKTAAAIIVVLIVRGALVVAVERIFPPRNQPWERTEEMVNDGSQTTFRLFGVGAVSIAIVIVLALAFGFF